MAQCMAMPRRDTVVGRPHASSYCTVRRLAKRTVASSVAAYSWRPNFPPRHGKSASARVPDRRWAASASASALLERAVGHLLSLDKDLVQLGSESRKHSADST